MEPDSRDVGWFSKMTSRLLQSRVYSGRPDLIRVPDRLYLAGGSPLGWEHINLTGDYVWRQNKRVEHRKFRSLRPLAVA